MRAPYGHITLPAPVCLPQAFGISRCEQLVLMRLQAQYAALQTQQLTASKAGGAGSGSGGGGQGQGGSGAHQTPSSAAGPSSPSGVRTHPSETAPGMPNGQGSGGPSTQGSGGLPPPPAATLTGAPALLTVTPQGAAGAGMGWDRVVTQAAAPSVMPHSNSSAQLVTTSHLTGPPPPPPLSHAPSRPLPNKCADEGLGELPSVAPSGTHLTPEQDPVPTAMGGFPAAGQGSTPAAGGCPLVSKLAPVLSTLAHTTGEAEGEAHPAQLEPPAADPSAVPPASTLDLAPAVHEPPAPAAAPTEPLTLNTPHPQAALSPSTAQPKQPAAPAQSEQEPAPGPPYQQGLEVQGEAAVREGQQGQDAEMPQQELQEQEVEPPQQEVSQAPQEEGDEGIAPAMLEGEMPDPVDEDDAFNRIIMDCDRELME